MSHLWRLPDMGLHCLTICLHATLQYKAGLSLNMTADPKFITFSCSTKHELLNEQYIHIARTNRIFTLQSPKPVIYPAHKC